ncbi:MAG: helix-hairpin-helix domain-containing protein [Prevotella sp.]|nr:helix-hairpin-helix domain-containing protein [Prevotella sp.]
MKFFRNLFFIGANDRKVYIFLLTVALLGIGGALLLDQQQITTKMTTADSISNGHAQTFRTANGTMVSYQQLDGRTVERFPFDPNTADSAQLSRLGFAPWQIRNIYKYRSKGGVYRHAEDLGRLYGMTVEQYRSLEPYIRISGDYRPATAIVGDHPVYDAYDRDTLLFPIKLKPGEHIVLNTADTTTLKKVPGIGSGWARMISAYGKKLGGYVAVEQLREIEGFPEDALAYFVVSNPQPELMNLNELTLGQLRQHPYLNYYQARAIIDYRRLKGNIQSLEQLSLLNDFPPHAIERLKPYVKF